MSQVAPSVVWNIRAAVPAIQLSLSPVKLTLTVSGVGRVWEQDGMLSSDGFLGGMRSLAIS